MRCMFGRRHRTAVVLLLAAALALPGVAKAQYLVSTSGSLTMSSDPGDWVGSGGSYSFSTPGDTFFGHSDGTTVDASIVPEPGAPTRTAMLSGFTEGWYEVIHASGRSDRVSWDARELPFLWLYGEFGGTKGAPYNRFYTLALEPFSRNPYSRNRLAA